MLTGGWIFKPVRTFPAFGLPTNIPACQRPPGPRSGLRARHRAVRPTRPRIPAGRRPTGRAGWPIMFDSISCFAPCANQLFVDAISHFTLNLPTMIYLSIVSFTRSFIFVSLKPISRFAQPRPIITKKSCSVAESTYSL